MPQLIAVTGEGVAKGVLECYGAEERRELNHPRAESSWGQQAQGLGGL